jgi:DNA polymerase III delta prime subunit
MIIGHQKQLQFLEQSRQAGRLGHAYLLSGPSKIGKKTVALEWLSRLLETPLNETIAHADFIFVSPLADPKTGQIANEITVDQIRTLIKKLSLKSSLGKYKAAIIDNAHLMNSESQNCLLKTLEEPPGDSIIILIAQNSQRLLETIRSRCEVLQFNFVSQKDIENYARTNNGGLDEISLSQIVKLSFGRPGRLIEFINDNARAKLWQERSKEFSRAVASELPERFAYVKKITEEDNLDDELEIWQFYFRNLMLDNLNGKKEETALSPEKSQFVFTRSRSSGYSLEQITAILKKIHELTVILSTTNASPNLALENFMLEV